MTPTCYLIKNPSGKKHNLTQAASSFDWGGSTDSVARTLDIAYLNAPYDPVLRKLPTISCGDYVIFKYSRKERFYGRVYSVEKTSEAGTVTIHCIDNSQFLLKNTVNRIFKNTTPEAIAKKLCAEFGMKTGSIAPTGINIKRLICKEDTIIDIIMKAYTIAHKSNGKKYMPLMKDRKFCIIEKGKMVSGFTASESTNITSSSYTVSTEDIVDKVVAYNDKGKKVGVFTNASNIKKYGSFQAVYNKESGVPVSSGAKAMLAGPSQSLSLECIGDINCISGYGIKVSDKATGRSGKYWIKTDNHHFKNGVHTMSLELEFKNIMSTVADDDEDSSSSKKTSSKKTSNKEKS